MSLSLFVFTLTVLKLLGFFFCSGFSLKFGFFWSHTKFWGLVFVVVDGFWVLVLGSFLILQVLL